MPTINVNNLDLNLVGIACSTPNYTIENVWSLPNCTLENVQILPQANASTYTLPPLVICTRDDLLDIFPLEGYEMSAYRGQTLQVSECCAGWVKWDFMDLTMRCGMCTKALYLRHHIHEIPYLPMVGICDYLPAQ